MEHIFRFIEVSLIPEPAARSAAPGVSPGRGLLILRYESHPPLFVGLVWFGRSTFLLMSLNSGLVTRNVVIG